MEIDAMKMGETTRRSASMMRLANESPFILPSSCDYDDRRVVDD